MDYKLRKSRINLIVAKSQGYLVKTLILQVLMFWGCKARTSALQSSDLHYVDARVTKIVSETPSIKIGSDLITLEGRNLLVKADTKKPILRYTLPGEPQSEEILELRFADQHSSLLKSYTAVPSKKADKLILDYYRDKALVAQTILSEEYFEMSCNDCEITANGYIPFAANRRVKYFTKQALVLTDYKNISAQNSSMSGYIPSQYMRMDWGASKFNSPLLFEQTCAWVDRIGLQCLDQVKPRTVNIENAEPFSLVKLLVDDWNSPVYILTDAEGKSNFEIASDLGVYISYYDFEEEVEASLHSVNISLPVFRAEPRTFKIATKKPIEKMRILLEQGPYLVETQLRAQIQSGRVIRLPLASGYQVEVFSESQRICDRKFKLSAECGDE
jgi:hypothetical protein